MSYLIVVPDGRKSKYGINVVLGALEAVSRDARPTLVSPMRGEDLSTLIAESIEAHDIALFLWSCYSPEFYDTVERMERVRDATPDGLRTLHLLGGVHGTAEPELSLRAGFDYVLVGEGERAILDIHASLLGGRALDDVPGICWLDHEGRFRRNKAAEVSDLDCYPAFSTHYGRYNPIEITRGCIYACKFCQTPFAFKARFRHRSIANVLEHVEKQVATGKTDVRFITPTSLSYGSSDTEPNLQAVSDLLSSVRTILPRHGRVFFGSFPSEIRPEHVTAESINLIKHLVDNDNIIIGAQSGSERILEESGRGHDRRSVVEAVAACRVAGFKVNVDFIFGMPGEDEESIRDSISLAYEVAKLGARIHAHTFMPLPGTPWSHHLPTPLTDDLKRMIAELTTSGNLYGSWSQQVQLSQMLAKMDSHANRRKRLRLAGSE